MLILISIKRNAKVEYFLSAYPELEAAVTEERARQTKVDSILAATHSGHTTFSQRRRYARRTAAQFELAAEKREARKKQRTGGGTKAD